MRGPTGTSKRRDASSSDGVRPARSASVQPSCPGSRTSRVTESSAEARQFFDGLSYSQRQWFVLGIEDAKTPETRQRRIDKAVARLRERRAQR